LQRVQELFKARGATPERILDSCEYALLLQAAGDLSFDVSGARIISDLLAKLVSCLEKNMQIVFSLFCFPLLRHQIGQFNSINHSFYSIQVVTKGGGIVQRLTAGALLSRLVYLAPTKE
jgi:hypothetical protein